MKIKLLFFCITLSYWSFSCLFANDREIDNSHSNTISIEDYCFFLNEVATYDPQHFYEESNKQILRSGKLGDYHYEAASQDPLTPIFLLSESSAKYYNIYQNHSQEKDKSFIYNASLEVSFFPISNITDPFLQSNLWSFCLQKNENFIHEATGAEVGNNGILDQILEFFLISEIGTSTVGREQDTLNRTSSSLPAEELLAHLSPTPSLDLIIDEDLEQVSMRKFFTPLHDNYNYYEASDVLLPASKRAWEARAFARQELQTKAEIQEQAEEKSKKEEELLNNKNLNKTTAGRVANFFNKGSDITAASGTISGLFKGAATVIDIGNRRSEKASNKKAQEAFKATQKEVEIAKQHFEHVEKEALAIDTQIKQKEQQGHKNLENEVMSKAKKIKPPVLSNKEDDWLQWAKELANNIATNWEEITSFARKAKQNPRWAAHQAAKAWMEKITYSAQQLNDIKQKQKSELSFLVDPYALAQKEAEEARSTATAACDYWDCAIQAERDAHDEYENIKSYLEHLESQKTETAVLFQAIEQAKIALQNASDAWEKSKTALEKKRRESLELIRETEENARLAESDVLKLFQQKEVIERSYERKIIRAKIALKANKKAWAKVWPEELLYQKLQHHHGEHAFEQAATTKTPMAWLTAENEAKELESLWKQMNFSKQEQFWATCIKVAVEKQSFLEIQELWQHFSDAAETFIENPNFESDYKNSQELTKKAEETASGVEERLEKIHRLMNLSALEAEMPLLIKSIRNVAKLAGITANSPKRLSSNNLADFAKTAEEMKSKAWQIAETKSMLWKEEASWIARATEKGDDFVNRMMIGHSYSNEISFREKAEGELRKFSKFTSDVRKFYRDNIRYIRARQQTIEKGLEPQRKTLLERKNSFFRRERKWHGENALFNLRKKLRFQQKIQSIEKQGAIEGTPNTNSISFEKSLELITATTELPENLLEDPEMQTEGIRLAKERIALDQEKLTLAQKEEELKQREIEIVENRRAMDQQSEGLKLQEQNLFQEQEALVREQKQNQEKEKFLEERAITLRAEELRITQDKAMLAEKAMSLKRIEFDLGQEQATLIQKEKELKKIEIEIIKNKKALEQQLQNLELQEQALAAKQLQFKEKETFLESKATELELEELKVTRERDALASKAASLKIKELTLRQEQTVFAEKEKEIKQYELQLTENERAIKQELEKLKLQEQALEAKKTVVNIEGIRITEEREALAKKAESLKIIAAIELETQAWSSFLEKLNQAIEKEKNAVLQAKCIKDTESIVAGAAWHEAHQAAFFLKQLWEELIQHLKQKRTSVTMSSEEVDLALKDALHERKSWAIKAGESEEKIKQSRRHEQKVNIISKNNINNISQDWQTYQENLPEELLSITHALEQYTQRTNTSFTIAQQSKNAADWMNAANKASFVENMGNEALEIYDQFLSENIIPEETQNKILRKIEAIKIEKEFWKEKIKFAKEKAHFAKAKIAWDHFSSVLPTFISNTNKVNLKIALEACTAARDAAAKVEHNTADNINRTVYNISRAAAESYRAAYRIHYYDNYNPPVIIDPEESKLAAIQQVAKSAEAAKTVTLTVDTDWKEESLWTVNATEEVITFSEALIRFLKKEKNSVVEENLEKSIQDAEASCLAAQNSKNESDWMNAFQKAEAIEISSNNALKVYEDFLLEPSLSEEEQQIIKEKIQKVQLQKETWLKKAKLAKAKIGFAQAKAAWTEFSTAATSFLNSPNTANLRKAAEAAYIVHIVSTATDIAKTAYATSISPIIDTIYAAYVVSINNHAGYADAILAHITERTTINNNTHNIDTDLEEEIHWAITATQEATAFIKAALAFHKEKANQHL